MNESPITAKVVAHSKCPEGPEIVTFEVEQPKFLNAEVNTHRMFSRNGSSSRAIPTAQIIEQIKNSPYIPFDVRANEKGMQGFEQVSPEIYEDFKEELQTLLLQLTEFARDASAKEGLNIHKQHISRYLEPFMMQKFLITTTELDNWFALRDHDAAQPEIRDLAKKMRIALEASSPIHIDYNEWHCPYFQDVPKNLEDGRFPEELLISAGCAAAVSYRNKPDPTKAIAIADKLLESGHMSPFEHIATPLDPKMCLGDASNSPFADSHISIRLDGSLWGANFRGWGQLRGILERAKELE